MLEYFRNMEQENNSYFQEVRNNISITVFINLIKLYFLGTTQEDINEPAICLHKLEQLKLQNEFSTSEYTKSLYIGARIEFVKYWLERECIRIDERSQIKKQDINQQLCRKLHIGKNLDIRCREYNFRRPKNYKRFLRRKSKTFSRK